MELTSGQFSGTTVLGGVLPGTVAGTVTGSQLSLALTFQTSPSTVAIFTTETGEVKSGGNEMSGSGSWVYGPSGNPPPYGTGTFTASRIRSIQAIEKAEEEAREKAKREAEAEKIKQEAEAAKAKEEAEAAKKQEAEAEKAKQEAAAVIAQQEKAKKEAEAAQVKGLQEKAEREKREAQERVEKGKVAGSVLRAAGLIAKTYTVSSSGIVELNLSNVNGYAISGEVILSAAGGAKAGKVSRGKRTILGSSTFTVSPSGTKRVAVKLSRGARAGLQRGKTLHVIVKVVTHARGHSAITKTYDMTLKALVRRRH